MHSPSELAMSSLNGLIQCLFVWAVWVFVCWCLYVLMLNCYWVAWIEDLYLLAIFILFLRVCWNLFFSLVKIFWNELYRKTAHCAQLGTLNLNSNTQKLDEIGSYWLFLIFLCRKNISLWKNYQKSKSSFWGGI